MQTIKPMRLVCIIEVAGAATVEEAVLALDAFREAVIPSVNYGLTIFKATPEDLAETLTGAVHHDRLMKEIDHEVNTYGVASLAGLISSLLDARCDTDDNSEKAAHYRAARDAFGDVSKRLAKLGRPFDLPDTFRA